MQILFRKFRIKNILSSKSKMSTLQKRPVKLTEDVLYVFAERLLARIPDNGQKIDFHYNEKNPYALFMGHNEKSFRTIIAQFAKFKRIDFAKFGADEQIEFYKNEDKYSFNDSEPAEFRGPYIVPKGMLEYIIEKGKFRVNTIEAFNYLPDDHTTDIKGIEGMNSLKAFCALFFGKQIEIPEGLSNNLMVKKFKIDESVENIQNNFETILAIDAVELEISNRDNVIIDCSQYKGTIIAKNTIKIAINCQFNFKSSKEEVKKFGTNFETFCSFLVRTCPALNNLNITICSSLNSIDSSIGVFVENFYSTVKAMEESIESINTDNENLQISIELVANFPPYIYDDLPIQSHDLFKLGTAFTVESIAEDDGDRYVARSLDCVDVGGRNHKLLFKIFEEIVSDADSMDFYDYGYDDAGGYDDYEELDVDDEVDYDDEPY